MKYSITGILSAFDEVRATDMIEEYHPWSFIMNRNLENSTFSFEAHVNTEDEKTALFDNLKSLVKSSNDVLEWHECTHDEPVSRACNIAETYVKR